MVGFPNNRVFLPTNDHFGVCFGGSKPEKNKKTIPEFTDASYLFGFFFFMDLVGTASMVLDSRGPILSCCW